MDPSGERTGERAAVEREIEERATDEARRRGRTPSEGVLERALEIEPGVEQHAGEDPGGVPRADDDEA